MKLSKKNIIILGSCIIAVLGLTGINMKANAGGYAGISANYIDTEITNHFGTTIKGGYSFNDFLAVEGRYLVNSSDEGYQGVSIEIDSLYGVYLIGSIPVTDSVSAYVLFGHSEGEVKASYRGYSESADDGSSSLGFGLKYDIIELWSVTAEYTELFDEIDQMSVGLQLNF